MLFDLQSAQNVWIDNLALVLARKDLAPQQTAVINGEERDTRLWLTNVTLWGDDREAIGINMASNSLYVRGACEAA